MSQNTVAQNVIWRIFERFGVQTITLIASIFLARLVEPETYGTKAIVAVIITILCVLADGGLSYSLIRKKDADDLDFSSVFYFDLVVCIILYAILFLSSSSIAKFYNVEELSSIIKIYGTYILIFAFTNIQTAYISRHLIFKKFFYSNLISIIISAAVSVWMAFKGYGVWALVAQYLLNSLISTIIMWCIVGWKPKLSFSFSRLKSLFSFGWKMLISSLLDTFWGQLRQLIIGKKYTTEDLACYDKALNYSDAASSSIMSAFDTVLLPAMANAQDDVVKVKELTRNSIKVGSFVLWPVLIGFAACADNLVELLLTEKWLPVVPYFRIFCLTYCFFSIHTPNLNAIKALGRSDIFLKVGVIKKVIELVIIIVSVRYGVHAIALGVLISNIIAQVINSWPNRKLINYKYIDQIKDVFPVLLLSIIMGLIVYGINYLGLNILVTLFIQIILGVFIYVGLSYLFKIDSLFYCADVLKNIRNKSR